MSLKIMLPTDFSDNSWSSIIYALKLYANKECTFYFLHSIWINTSAMSSLSNKLKKTLKDSAMVELLKLKDLAEKTNENANHDFKIILTIEDIVESLKRLLPKYHINLIVMGTKGATGAKKIIFGSNAVAIVKNLWFCPVLILPNAFEYVKPSQIAFPTDFNRDFGDSDLKAIKDLAGLYNSKIRIVHINKEEQLNDAQLYNLNSLKERLENYPYSFHWMPDYTNKVREIYDFIEELKIDVLAMIQYKNSIIETIIKEPVIKRIGFHPKIPFMVIPD